jgi:hypothetical protein
MRVGTHQTTTVLRICQCRTKKPSKDTFEVPVGKAFRSNTTFVRHHPFKTGWEVRKCMDCGAQWAVDASQLTT